MQSVPYNFIRGIELTAEHLDLEVDFSRLAPNCGCNIGRRRRPKPGWNNRGGRRGAKLRGAGIRLRASGIEGTGSYSRSVQREQPFATRLCF